MNQKHWTIGGRYRKIKALLSLLYISIFGFGATFCVCAWLKLPFTIYLVSSILLTIAFIMLWWSSIFKMQPFWDLDQNYLTYYNCNRFMDQLNMWFKKSAYSFKLNVEQIESLLIYSYSHDLFVYGNRTHDVYFLITTKDGSQFKMLGIIDHRNDIFLEALDYLKSRNINIIDRYNVIDTLKDPKKYLWTEIDRQKKERGLDS